MNYCFCVGIHDLSKLETTGSRNVAKEPWLVSSRGDRNSRQSQHICWLSRGTDWIYILCKNIYIYMYYTYLYVHSWQTHVFMIRVTFTLPQQWHFSCPGYTDESAGKRLRAGWAPSDSPVGPWTTQRKLNSGHQLSSAPYQQRQKPPCKRQLPLKYGNYHWN